MILPGMSHNYYLGETMNLAARRQDDPDYVPHPPDDPVWDLRMDEACGQPYGVSTVSLYLGT